MLERDRWLDLARHLGWDVSYVGEEAAFLKTAAGEPQLDRGAWKDWEESFRTSFREYATTQHEKEKALAAVRDAAGRLALAEFGAVIGNLRAARFGRSSAWRTVATLGAPIRTPAGGPTR
jgi:toluene monooxygenase system protein A